MKYMKGDTWTAVPTDKQLAGAWIREWQSLGNQNLISGTASHRITVTTTLADTAMVYAGPTTLSCVWTNDGAVPISMVQATGPGTGAAPPRRRPAPLEFSPYINATELVLEFLTEARQRIPGLTRERFLRLTIADFFAFLIRRAAEMDGVPPPEMEDHDLPIPIRQHRCGWCSRFLPRRFELLRMYHCNVRCLERAAVRDGIVVAA